MKRKKNDVDECKMKIPPHDLFCAFFISFIRKFTVIFIGLEVTRVVRQVCCIRVYRLLKKSILFKSKICCERIKWHGSRKSRKKICQRTRYVKFNALMSN